MEDAILPKGNPSRGNAYFWELCLRVSKKFPDYMVNADDENWYKFVGKYFWTPQWESGSKEYNASMVQAVKDTFIFYKKIGDFQAVISKGYPVHIDAYELLIDAWIMEVKK